MSDKNWTPGPWRVGFEDGSGVGSFNDDWRDSGAYITAGDEVVVRGGNPEGDLCFGVLNPANAHLIRTAPELYAEMERFLPIIDRAEAAPELWARLTQGTGIATANAYRAVLAKARGAQ